MTNTNPKTEPKTPAYMSYGRWEGWIGGLHGKPVPPRVDRTLMSRMSGAEQSQLRVTNKFLGMIEGDSGTVTDRMRELVAAYGTDAWKPTLARVIEEAYRPIVGDLDSAATQGQLTEHFRERGGVVGSANQKAVRFYLAAANAAGIEVSPHFKSAPQVSSPPSNGERQRRVRRPRETGNGGDVTPKVTPPDGVEVYAAPIPGGGEFRVWVPAGVSDEDFEFALTTFKRYRKLKQGGKKSRPPSE